MRRITLRTALIVGAVGVGVVLQVAVLSALVAHARADDDSKVACIKYGADTKVCIRDRGTKYTVSCEMRGVRPGHDDWSGCWNPAACTSKDATTVNSCVNPDACVSRDAQGWWQWCAGVPQGIPASCRWMYFGHVTCQPWVSVDAPPGTKAETRP